MGVFKTADGRSLVGIGQQDGNEYSGFAGWRDCVIQLTASGATEDSVKYLNAIKDYAIAHNAKGESIMPPNLSIWISNNGVTTAVQADDIAVDGANVTICGIKWNGTVWDYTDAGKGGGGSGGATSLADLSDVSINQPLNNQLLIMNSESGKFRNWTATPSVIGYPDRVEGVPAQSLWGVRVLSGKPNDGVFGYSWLSSEDIPLVYRAELADETLVATFNTLISNVKTVAKSSGKAGIQIPYSGGDFVSRMMGQAALKRMIMLKIGLESQPIESLYFTLSSIDKNSLSFRADHTDADGIYHITTAFTATSAMLSCEYTTCPAMS